MGGATQQGIDHDVEVQEARQNNWTCITSRSLVILLTEVLGVLRAAWGVLGMVRGLQLAQIVIELRGRCCAYHRTLPRLTLLSRKFTTTWVFKNGVHEMDRPVTCIVHISQNTPRYTAKLALTPSKCSFCSNATLPSRSPIIVRIKE
jgi:hypothetical protein